MVPMLRTLWCIVAAVTGAHGKRIGVLPRVGVGTAAPMPVAATAAAPQAVPGAPAERPRNWTSRISLFPDRGAVLDEPRARTGGHVESSVSNQVELLEAVQPASANFNMQSIEGVWQLQYTNDLDAAVHKELLPYLTGTATSLSITLSVTASGEMLTTAAITLSNGERKVASVHSQMAHVEGTPRFIVKDHEGNSRSVVVTSRYENVCILRKEPEDRDALAQWLDLNGIAQRRTSKLEVWKKLDEHEPVGLQSASRTGSEFGPASFWRFGLSDPGVDIATTSAAWVSPRAADTTVLEPPVETKIPETTISIGAALKEDPKQRRADKYRLLLFNDPVNKREFVSRCLMTICLLKESDAYQVMMKAHKEGVAIIGTYGYETAEAYCEGLKAKGLMVDIIPADGDDE